MLLFLMIFDDDDVDLITLEVIDSRDIFLVIDSHLQHKIAASHIFIKSLRTLIIDFFLLK